MNNRTLSRLAAFSCVCLASFASWTAAQAQTVPTITLANPLPGTTTTTPNKFSQVAWLTADGRYLTFSSNATNLVAGFTDNNEASQGGGAGDLFQRDMQTGAVTLITHAAGTTNQGASLALVSDRHFS